MNAKELIEAARRILEIPDIHDDLTAVCLHTLATVREDDDEPITDQWLCEICIRTDGDWDYWQLKKIGASEANVSKQDGIYYFRISLFRACQVTTRGQLRRLISALKGE